MQRDLRVRAVYRLAAAVGLQVDRVARRHEGGDVRDGVVHDVAVAVPLDVQRLVEVHRGLGVDGDEGDVGPVQVREPRLVRGHLSRPFHLGGEVGCDAELLLDLLDALS